MVFGFWVCVSGFGFMVLGVGLYICFMVLGFWFWVSGFGTMGLDLGPVPEKIQEF